MSHFAQVNDNNIVTNIIVCDKHTIDSGKFGDPYNWIETDPLTKGNMHYDINGKPDGGTPLRGNYAAIGGKYDRINDVFYPLRPFASWSIDSSDWTWKPPIPKPAATETIRYYWNDSTLDWDPVVKL